MPLSTFIVTRRFVIVRGEIEAPHGPKGLLDVRNWLPGMPNEALAQQHERRVMSNDW